MNYPSRIIWWSDWALVVGASNSVFSAPLDLIYNRARFKTLTALINTAGYIAVTVNTGSVQGDTWSRQGRLVNWAMCSDQSEHSWKSGDWWTWAGDPGRILCQHNGTARVSLLFCCHTDTQLKLKLFLCVCSYFVMCCSSVSFTVSLISINVVEMSLKKKLMLLSHVEPMFIFTSIYLMQH